MKSEINVSESSKHPGDAPDHISCQGTNEDLLMGINGTRHVYGKRFHKLR